MMSTFRKIEHIFGVKFVNECANLRVFNQKQGKIRVVAWTQTLDLFTEGR